MTSGRQESLKCFTYKLQQFHDSGRLDCDGSNYLFICRWRLYSPYIIIHCNEHICIIDIINLTARNLSAWTPLQARQEVSGPTGISDIMKTETHSYRKVIDVQPTYDL
jgi:hypothetical protein